MWTSVVAEVSGNVSSELHRIVQHPSDPDQVGTSKPVKQEMAWPQHDPMLGARPLATVTQVIGTKIFTEFRSSDASDPHRLGSYVAHRGYEKTLVAQTGDRSKSGFRVGKHVHDVRPRGAGETVVWHGSPAVTTDAIGRFSSQASDELLQFVIADIFETAFVNVLKTDAGRVPKRLEFGRFLRLALFDQSQAIAQHLAGILIAAGLDQLFNNRIQVVRQHNVSGWHLHVLSSHWLRTMARYGILCQWRIGSG